MVSQTADFSVQKEQSCILGVWECTSESALHVFFVAWIYSSEDRAVSGPCGVFVWQHEPARGAEEVRQGHRPAHQSGALLHAATAAGPQADEAVQHPPRWHQARQHLGGCTQHFHTGCASVCLFFSISLSHTGNSAHLTWAWQSNCKSCGTILACPNSGMAACIWDFQHVNRCWCVWLYTGGCTDTVRESALEADWEKNPLLHWGLKPASVSHLAFQLDTLPSELCPPQLQGYSVLAPWLAWCSCSVLPWPVYWLHWFENAYHSLGFIHWS